MISEMIPGYGRTAEADSLSDLISFLSGTRCVWRREGSAEERSWAGTPNIKAAYDLARFGWSEGREKMATGMATAAMLKPPAPVASWELDVAGSFPDVPSYCAGSPACMVSFSEETPHAKPIIRFVVGLFVSAAVDHATITNRGAAILSYADKLEREGARVEIVAAYLTRDNKKHFAMTFPIKAASEPLDVDKAAFVMAHPSMFRRICFATLERFKDLEDPFTNGYGSGLDTMPAAMQAPNSVYFPCLRTDEGDRFKTMAMAMDAVERTIKDSIG